MTVLEAAHIANIEQRHDYTDTVLGFLTQPRVRRNNGRPRTA